MNWRDTTHFDSEDDYRTGCRNVSHCHQQQSCWGLRSPGRSYSAYFWNDSWVQTLISHYYYYHHYFFIIFSLVLEDAVYLWRKPKTQRKKFNWKRRFHSAATVTGPPRQNWPIRLQENDNTFREIWLWTIVGQSAAHKIRQKVTRSTKFEYCQYW